MVYIKGSVIQCLAVKKTYISSVYHYILINMYINFMFYVQTDLVTQLTLHVT